MDINKILNSDYLDILFEGRNKKYGSYELRKKYNRRIVLGALIAFFVFSAFFLSTLIKPKAKVMADIPVITPVRLTPPPPIDKKNPPPPPPAALPPPPVKPTFKFTPPVIKKDQEVKEEDVPEPPKPDEHKIVGPKTMAGSNDPGSMDPNLNTNPGTGKGPVVDASPKEEQIFRFVDQEAVPPGGVDAFQRYLHDHVAYPYAAKQANLQGRVTYQFVVDQNGNITDIQILKDIGGGCGDAIIKALQNYRKRWTPAKNNGHPVKVYYTGNFNFTLQ